MRTFEDYAANRLALLDGCRRLEEVARQFQASQGSHELQVVPEVDHDLISSLLRDARTRLERASLEVGVFGQIKRGKSTLVNALIGEEVTSMRVTPETAVPVWIDGEDRLPEVMYSDGTVERVQDRTRAAEMATQRFKERSEKRRVTRVFQHVSAPWLRSGVRLIDTPGLADPALADELEKLTLSELDRVAVAVLVFCQPPGLDRDEVKLLQSLAQRSIDKVFLVCNFYSDGWESPEDRLQITQHISSTLEAASGGSFVEGRVRLYEVNARMGWRAADEGDAALLAESGVKALRDDLEDYLSGGAISRVRQLTGQRLNEAGRLLNLRLMQRLEALSDPSSFAVVESNIQGRIDGVANQLGAVSKRVRGLEQGVVKEILSITAAPFDETLSELEGISRRSELTLLADKLQIRVETMISRLTSQLREVYFDIDVLVAREIGALFGGTLTESITDSPRMNIPTGLDYSIRFSGGSDGSRMAAGALAGGVTLGAGAGLVGGSLAGGAGLALLAAGPVGWAIGAGLGLVLGGVLGAGGGGLAAAMTVSSDTKERARLQIESERQKMKMQARQMTSDLFEDAEVHVRGLLTALAADDQRELELFRSFASDQSGNAERLRQTREMLDEIDRVGRFGT